MSTVFLFFGLNGFDRGGHGVGSGIGTGKEKMTGYIP